MLLLIVVSALLLAVAIFALQNAQEVTIRFFYWEIQSSVAVVTLVATAVGVLIAGAVGTTGRLRRWKRGRGAPLRSEPPSSTGPSPSEGPRLQRGEQ